MSRRYRYDINYFSKTGNTQILNLKIDIQINGFITH